ncbi:hypothetical protein ASPZODRAFT_150489 [Penicilliopsis zonata CBS 506.65]|uniref:MARVEL domain-containing protein n=1 Tax=Penicilliopsis zonata CBS 506.65 TaxID=1073090 RepID=A0A1L9SLP5_9EURO|nr:hypothetical protein ASPZODRAFT_150489 [Penicilliopsis zonata CBS 506.65]OJJ48212.1 hypothetical protein ASPZODRAFT_150489 [Penicilliopsis zonata CBS 506.65]
MRRPFNGAANPARIKNTIHGFQGFIIFLAWALTIAVFTKGDGMDGRSLWYWALCWVTVPALIYLVAVPMWPRARRFGNVYAFATIDCLFTIFWFSAWVAVADYVAEGKSKGKTDSKSGCDAWSYGSASKCEISTATVILGVVIFLLFIATSWLSFRNVFHFRRTGTLPDMGNDPTFAAQTQDAFSSNPHEFEDDEDEFRSGRAEMGVPPSRGDRDEDYALLQHSEIDDLGGRSALQGAYDPTAPAPGGVLHDYNTGYGGAHGQHYAPPSEYEPTSEYGR